MASYKERIHNLVLVRQFDARYYNLELELVDVDGLKMWCFFKIIEYDFLIYRYIIFKFFIYLIFFFFFFFFRKLLYKVGEETGKDELQNLKAYLSSKVGVGKRTLDLIRDVWDCLDVLEERLSDSEMFPLLKTVYAADVKLSGLLDDFIKGMN